MRILIYLGHPAQYHFFKNIAKNLKRDNKIQFLIKTKEVLEPLLLADGAEFRNILPKGRRSTRTGVIWGLVKRELMVLREALRFKPDLMLGADPSLAHIGKLLRIPVLTVLEDDVHVIYDLAKITFPFSTHIIAPDSCDCGKWNGKKISYAGYMKLAYLHPNHFECEPASSQKTVLIRLSSLEAFHDKGVKGFDEILLKEIIARLRSEYKILLSSEKPINPYFDEYLLRINPCDMHKVLSNASILISDSQSMTMEAAMLGIPSIRYSDFAGRIGVLEELEHQYNLTYGIKPGNADKLFHKLENFLSIPDLREEFQQRRMNMLKDKVDVTMFFTWLINNYPDSALKLKDDPKWQYNFK
jgi:hypothetical protein